VVLSLGFTRIGKAILGLDEKVGSNLTPYLAACFLIMNHPLMLKEYDEVVSSYYVDARMVLGAQQNAMFRESDLERKTVMASSAYTRVGILETLQRISSRVSANIITTEFEGQRYILPIPDATNVAGIEVAAHDNFNGSRREKKEFQKTVGEAVHNMEALRESSASNKNLLNDK